MSGSHRMDGLSQSIRAGNEPWHEGPYDRLGAYGECRGIEQRSCEMSAWLKVQPPCISPGTAFTDRRKYLWTHY